jgi:hypothetical protein
MAKEAVDASFTRVSRDMTFRFTNIPYLAAYL